MTLWLVALGNGTGPPLELPFHDVADPARRRIVRAHKGGRVNAVRAAGGREFVLERAAWVWGCGLVRGLGSLIRGPDGSRNLEAVLILANSPVAHSFCTLPF